MSLKKLISLFTALLIALGTSGPNSAMADSPYSAATPTSANAWEMGFIPLNDQGSLMVWASGNELQAAVLSLDGTVSHNVTLDQGVSAFSSNRNGWARLPDGTVAVTWISSFYDQNAGTTTKTVKVAYTSDGIDWTQPIAPFEPLTFLTSNCEYDSCGYREARISSDKFGSLVLAAINVDGGQFSDPKLFLKSSSNGTSWSSSTVFTKQSNGLQLQTLAALPSGGFMATWVENTGHDVSLFAVRTVGVTVPSWTRPVLLETVAGYGNSGLLLQTGPKSMGLFFITEVVNEYTTMYRKDFNEETKTWGAKQTVTVEARSFLSYSGMIGDYRHGVTTVLATFGVYGQSTTNMRGVYVVNGVTKPVIERTLDGAQDTTPLLVGARADGSIYFGWAGQFVAPHLSVYKNGTEVSGEDIPTGLTRAYGSAGISQNGNIFFYFSHYSPAEVRLTMTYRGATAPAATGFLSVNGIAKVGKTLSAKVPTFSSPSGTGTTNFQWYLCSSPIATSQSSIPAGCVPVAKATSPKFKVTSKQKNKFLCLAITNSNSVGNTVVFSKTTGKIR